jgi:transposase
MAKRRSPKAEALLCNGTLNPHPERVQDKSFLENDFFDPRDLLQVKYEMVRKTQVEGEAVTKAAGAFGFSRPSLYQARRAFEQGGLSGLIPQRRGPKQAHKLTGAVMAFIQEALQADESLSMAELVRMVKEQFDVRVHRRSIERALVRRQKKGR